MTKKSKFFVTILLLIVGMFVNISIGNAAEYSSASCVYGWADNSQLATSPKFSFSAKYTTKGKLDIPTTVSVTKMGTKNGCNPYNSCGTYDIAACPVCQEFKTVKYKVVNIDLKASDFISGKYFKSVCPGDNDVDFYMDDDNKKIYVSWSENGLKNYLNSKNISYSRDLSKAKLTSSNFTRGNKIVINGKTYNVEAGRKCEYKSEDHGWKVSLELDKNNGTPLSAKFSGEGISASISKIDGTFSAKRCPKRISISGTTGAAIELAAITSSTKRITLFRDPDDGKYELAQVTDDKKSPTEDPDDAPDVNPLKINTKAKGCALWGTLLTFLNSYIYGTIKYTLVGALIVMGMLDFSKAVFSDKPDEVKKAGVKFAKRIVVVVLFFLLPIIIETLLKWFLSGETIETCLSSFK